MASGVEFLAPVMESVSGFASVMYYVVLLVLVVAPVLFFLWYKMTYTINFTVKTPIGDNTWQEHKTFGRYKTEDGVTFVELLKKFNGNKIQLKEIPGDAVSIDARGRKCVTIALFNDNAAFVKIKPADVPKEYSADFFSTDMQLMLAEQFKKSKKYDQLTVLKAINANAGIIAIVIIFVVLLAFWENVMAPTVAVQNAQATIEKAQADTTAKLHDMYQSVCFNKQRITPTTTTEGAP